jgi:hypothetical protein
MYIILAVGEGMKTRGDVNRAAFKLWRGSITADTKLKSVPPTLTFQLQHHAASSFHMISSMKVLQIRRGKGLESTRLSYS